MSERKHGVSFEFVGTTWVGRCGRHQTFVGDSYAECEDEWRRHVYEDTGVAPKPMGPGADRWQPPVLSGVVGPGGTER